MVQCGAQLVGVKEALARSLCGGLSDSWQGDDLHG